jgi:multiple antibiotic resistance protein
MDAISAAITLFLIMDPLGNLPIVMSVLKNIEPKRRRIVLIRELLIALAILVTFLFAGEAILSFLNLRQETVSIAGGIILFLIGIKMIFPPPGGIMGNSGDEEPFIVPLATPMIAGPSSMAAVVLLANEHPEHVNESLLALLIAWAATATILMFSNGFHRLLGEKGLQATERLMGMLLIMISVQMFLDGVARYLG